MVKKEDYVSDYKKRYKNQGKQASGGGDGVGKIVRWKQAGFVDGMSILDYGCGWGAILEGIKKKDLYLGIDIVPRAIELARETWPGVHFDTFEIGKLKTQKFDFIGAASVFTHTPYEVVDESLSDIKQAMDSESLGIIDFLEGNKNENIHIAYWPMKDFVKKLEDNGFSSEMIARVKHLNGYTHTYLKVRLI